MRSIEHARDPSATTAVALAFSAYLLFPMTDALVKTMGGVFPGPGIAMLRYGVSTLLLAAILLKKEGPGALSLRMPLIQWMRGFFLAGGTASFFTAIAFMPLAEAVAITFLGPVMVALLSGWLLNEETPASTWIASIIALIGVATITQPQIARIGWIGILPLCTAACNAFILILNRKVAGRASVTRMQYSISLSAFVCLVPIAFLASWSGVDAFELSVPSPVVLLKCCCVALGATIGHALLYMATERASAAVVAPATYMHLVVSGILGAMFFGNVPDLWVLVGMGLIVLSGLIVWRGSKKIALDAEGAVT